MGNSSTAYYYNQCLDDSYYPYINSPTYNNNTNISKNFNTSQLILNECNQQHSIIISCYIMMIILLVILVPQAMLTYKVKELVWNRDKIMPLMLLCLATSLFTFFLYFIFTLVAEYKLVWQYGYSKSYTCSVIYFGEMPAFFLSIGIILNANKWIYFLLRIKAFVKVDTLQAIRKISQNDFDDIRSSSKKYSDASSQLDTTRSRSATSLATKEIKFTNKIVVLNAVTWLLIFIYFVIFIVKTS